MSPVSDEWELLASGRGADVWVTLHRNSGPSGSELFLCVETPGWSFDFVLANIETVAAFRDTLIQFAAQPEGDLTMGRFGTDLVFLTRWPALDRLSLDVYADGASRVTLWLSGELLACLSGALYELTEEIERISEK